MDKTTYKAAVYIRLAISDDTPTESDIVQDQLKMINDYINANEESVFLWTKPHMRRWNVSACLSATTQQPRATACKINAKYSITTSKQARKEYFYGQNHI